MMVPGGTAGGETVVSVMPGVVEEEVLPAEAGVCTSATVTVK